MNRIQFLLAALAAISLPPMFGSLTAADPPSRERLAKLLDQLVSKDDAVRLPAVKELDRLGPAAVPELCGFEMDKYPVADAFVIAATGKPMDDNVRGRKVRRGCVTALARHLKQDCDRVPIGNITLPQDADKLMGELGKAKADKAILFLMLLGSFEDLSVFSEALAAFASVETAPKEPIQFLALTMMAGISLEPLPAKFAGERGDELRKTFVLVGRPTLGPLASLQNTVDTKIRELNLARVPPNVLLPWLDMSEWANETAKQVNQKLERDVKQTAELRAKYEKLRDTVGWKNPDTADAADALAIALNHQNRWSDAAAILKEYFVGIEAAFGRHHPVVAAVQSQHAALLGKQGQYLQAIKEIEDSLARLRDGRKKYTDTKYVKLSQDVEIDVLEVAVLVYGAAGKADEAARCSRERAALKKP